MIAKASALGVRHLALEALFDGALTERLNHERRLPPIESGYLSQPEMRQLINLALELDYTLIAYEADMASKPPGLESLSIEETNWREEQHANNIAGALDRLPANAAVLIWCGNHHLAKDRTADWVPMGSLLQSICGIEPFAIDQTPTVSFGHGHGPLAGDFASRFSKELDERGGTAGFLAEEAPYGWPCGGLADAFILSTDNELS
jgi:hypothetical protein